MTRSLENLFHAAPLHYVPAICNAGALYSKDVLAASHVLPRKSAARRDRMLGLGDYVHLSPTLQTPLLRDKITKGYPHAVFIFDGAAVLGLPEMALLPYNTKAWRTRAALVPVTDPSQQASLLRRYLSGNRLPSLEVLIKYGLSLDHLKAIAFITEYERQLVLETLKSIGVSTVNAVVEPSLFPEADDYQPRGLERTAEYFERCRQSGCMVVPPNIEFD